MAESGTVERMVAEYQGDGAVEPTPTHEEVGGNALDYVDEKINADTRETSSPATKQDEQEKNHHSSLEPGRQVQVPNDDEPHEGQSTSNKDKRDATHDKRGEPAPTTESGSAVDPPTIVSEQLNEQNENAGAEAGIREDEFELCSEHFSNEATSDTTRNMTQSQDKDETDAYFEMKASDEDKVGTSLGGKVVWFFKQVAGVGSSSPKNVLKDYRFELTKTDGGEVMKLKWNSSPNTMHNFELTQTSGGSPKTKRENTQDNEVVFSNLELGHEYKLEVKTEKRGSNKFCHFKFSTCPQIPKNLRFEKGKLKWDPVSGAEKLSVKCTSFQQPSIISGETCSIPFPKFDELIGTQTEVEIIAHGKDERQQTEIKQHLTIGGVTVPRSVIAQRANVDPYRSVLVSWDEPNSDTAPQCYIVRIECAGDDSYFKEDETKKRSYTFTKLMSQSIYVCSVQAKYHWNNISMPARSKPIETTLKKRGDIDMKKLGAAKQFDHELQYGDIVKCNMKWELPKIGKHSHDFEMKCILATLFEKGAKGERGKNLKVPDPPLSAKVDLQWGKRYEVHLTAQYQDLDSMEIVDAVTYHNITTDFEAIGEIHVVETGNDVKVTWSRSRGGASYLLNVFDELSTLVYDSKKFENVSEHTIRIGTELYWSREYEFQVLVHDEMHNKKETSKKYRIGKNAPKSVILSLDNDDPYRSMQLMWKKPDGCNPASYVYSLFDDSGAKFCEQTTSNMQVTVLRLKQGVEYYASVKGKMNKKLLPTAHSNKCKTKDGLVLRGDIGREGKITQLTTELGRSNSDDHATFTVSWQLPKIGRNLERHYHMLRMVCHIINKQTNRQMGVEKIKQRNDDLRHKISLQRGFDYIIRIIAIYKHLDSSDEPSAVFDEQLQTEIAEPSRINVNFLDGNMMITCAASTTYQTFNFSVVDVATSNVLVEAKDKKDSKCHLPIKHPYGYGKLCRFSVEAIPPNGRSKVLTSDETIIGGPTVPFNVIARKSRLNQRRNICVSWKAPPNSNKPRYKTMIIDMETGEAVAEKIVDSEETEFDNLKASAEYHAVVVAIQDKRPSHESRSNSVKTDQPLSTPTSLPEFSSEILIDRVNQQNDRAFVCWKPLALDEVYKTTAYKMDVSKKLMGFKVSHSSVEVDRKKHEKDGCFRVLVAGLKPNTQYYVTLEASVVNNDTGQTHKIHGDLPFHAVLKKPELKPVKLQGNRAIFQWDAIEGGLFNLEVKDKFTSNHIKKVPGIKDCEAVIELDADFRIGRPCQLVLGVYTESRKESVDTWTEYVIGGDEVPRNIIVKNNPTMPHRYVDIEFEPPVRGSPVEYIICAIDPSGRVEEKKTVKTLETFDYLRSNTEYIFEVTAVNEVDKSRGSRSAPISTKPWISSTVKSPFDFQSISKSNLDFSHSHFEASTNISTTLEASFDIVHEPIIECTKEDDSFETILIHWSPPLFKNRQDNYRIKFYIVRIATNGKNIFEKVFDSVKGKARYSTEPIPNLELGTEYNVTISSEYDDIDGMLRDCRSKPHKEIYQTRPCKPSIKNNYCDRTAEKICLEWLRAGGADEYWVEIFTPGKNEAAISEKTNHTHWDHKFTKDCRFGKTYYVRVTAVGAGRKNTQQSEETIIGGNSVPRDAQADRDVDCPTTAAVVKWNAPSDESFAQKYVVETISGSEDVVVSSTEFIETQGKVTALKPGTTYRFKVYAVSGDDKSAGCETNKIKTNPGPGKVIILEPKLDEKKDSTTVHIFWEKEETCTFYEVKILSMDKLRSFTQLIKTELNTCIVRSLTPGTLYKIAVTGGNENGVGNTSEYREITTKFGFVENVALSTTVSTTENDENNQNHSLTAHFEAATGNPKSYRVVLYDSARKKISEGTCTDPNAGVVFQQLIAHTAYYATVEAAYTAENSKQSVGKAIQSNFAWTPPDKPKDFKGELLKWKGADGISRNVVRLQWSQFQGCTSHKIEVNRKGRGKENTVVVDGALTNCDYHCMEEACDYVFRVSSQNSSNCYGEWPEAFHITLAPKSPANLKAELQEGGEIKLTWTKPETQVQCYLVSIYCNDKRENHEETSSSDYTLSKPTQAAEYHFLLSAKGLSGQISQQAKSNTVYSRPGKCNIENVEIPRSKLLQVSWEEVPNCNYHLQITKCTGKDKNMKVDLNEHTLNIAQKTTSCTYTCQEAGTRYKIRIRAVYKTSPGEWSKTKEVITYPGQVKNLKLEYHPEPSRVKICWTQPFPIPSSYHLQLYEIDVVKVGCKQPLFEEPRKIQPVADQHMSVEETVIPGKLYFAEVSAINPQGSGDSLKSQYLFIPPRPLQSFFTSPDKDNPARTAIIRWEKMDGVDLYKLNVSNQSSGSREFEVTENKYRFQDGIPGTTYDVSLYWRLRENPWEGPVIKQFTLAPAAVEGVELIENDNGGFTLKWKNMDPPPLHYVVEWEENDDRRNKNTGTTKQCRYDIKPEHGDAIIAKVAAANISGTGEFSEELEISIRPPPPQSIDVKPTKLNPESSLIVLIEDNYDKRKSYLVTAKPLPDGDAITKTSESMRVLLTELHPGKLYEISVEAILRKKKSASVSCLEPVRTYPGRVVVEVQSQNKSGLNFVWKAPHCDMEEYQIDWKRDEEDSQKLTTEKCKFRIQNTFAGCYYSVRVAARNSAGIGKKSDWTTVLTAPGNIESISAKQVDENVVFEWDFLDNVIEKFQLQWSMDSEDPFAAETVASHYRTEDATPGAECYILRWKNDKVVDYEYRETAETSVILDKLTPGSTYLLSVVAKNAVGTGKYSGPILLHTPPCAPVDLKVEKHDSSPESAFVVSFVDPDPNPDGKEYRVVAQPLSRDEDVAETMEKSLILLKGLTPGETYKVSAEIVDKKKELKSEKTFFKALCQTCPAEVANLDVKLEHDCLLITWEPLELAPRRYQISMNVNGQDMPLEFTEKPSFIVTNVSASSIYKVAVAAANDAGCGKFCEPEKCQTRPAGPLKVMAKQNPINRSSSLSVWMEDHDPVEKMYKVVAVDPNDQELVVETRNKYAVFNDLKSATPYRIFVVAILGTLESDPVWVSQLS